MKQSDRTSTTSTRATQSDTHPSPSIGARTTAVARWTCYHAVAATVAGVVKAGRALRLLPRGTDYFVGMAQRAGWDHWRDDQPSLQGRNLLAVIGWAELVVSIPAGAA